MKVRVNGEEREVQPSTTLAQLVETLGLRVEGVAVALNLQVVPRGRLASTSLSEGDQVEIVRAVGGG